jgi:hypothetical protein
MNRLICSLGLAALVFSASGELPASGQTGEEPRSAGAAPLHTRAARVLSGEHVTFAQAADRADRLQSDPARAGTSYTRTPQPRQ